MSIPDVAVAHIQPIPDFRLRDYIISRIERTWVPGSEVCDTATALVERLYESLIPPGTDYKLKWRGPRTSGIHRCELAQVHEARIAHLPRMQNARSSMILQTGHFLHAWFQAQLISERIEAGERIPLPDHAPIEETWPQEGLSPPWMAGLSGHSDQRFPPGHPAIPGIRGLVADYKTMGVAAGKDDKEHAHDGYLNFCTGGRPKNEYIVQATVYAVNSQSEQAAIIAVNTNRTIPAAYRKQWDAWADWCKATYGAEPSTFIHVLRFPADPALAAGAAEKARRIRAHVAAGTEPLCEVVARKESRRCWDCREVDAAIAAAAAGGTLAPPSHAHPQPGPIVAGVAEDDEPENPTFQEWHTVDQGRQFRWKQWFSKVVGRMYRGIDDAQLLTLVRSGDQLFLEWEPGNQHEIQRLPDGRACAVKVIHAPTGTWIGYLPSKNSPTALATAIVLAAGGIAHAQIFEIRGNTPDKPSVGLNILITTSTPA